MVEINNKYISSTHLSDNILIADNIYDQMLISSSWTILSGTDRHVTIPGTFTGRNMGEVFPVVSAKCVLRDASEKSSLLRMKHVLMHIHIKQNHFYRFTSHFV